MSKIIKLLIIQIIITNLLLMIFINKVYAQNIEYDKYKYNQIVKELKDYQLKKNDKKQAILKIESQLKKIENDIDSLISDINYYNTQIDNISKENEQITKDMAVILAKITSMQNERFYIINLISYIDSKVNILNEKQKLENKQIIFENNKLKLEQLIKEKNIKLDENEKLRTILTEIYDKNLIELNELNKKVSQLILTENDLLRYIKNWYVTIKNINEANYKINEYCENWLFDCSNTFVLPIESYVYKSQWFNADHLAVDLATYQWKNLISIDDWIVLKKIEAWYSMPWNWLYILHPNWYISIYWHILSYNVSVWDIVKKWDIIGKSWWEVWTYWAWKTTWPHLHFWLMLNWRYLNPDAFFDF